MSYTRTTSFLSGARGRPRRTVLAATALAAAAALVAGCSSASGASASGGSNSTKTLVIAQSLDPRSLYPTISNAQGEVNVSEQITEKLIEFNGNGTGFEPRLATSWKQLDDTTVQLKLRHGVKFTNGEAFNADSAKASIETMIAAPTYKASAEMIQGAEVVDPYTLNITLKHPSGLTLDALAAGSFQYPPKYFAQVGPDGFGTKPIGTGPYMLDNWVKGESVSLTANPNYWGGKPAIQHVKFAIIPDKQAQIVAAQSGSVDVVQSVPVGALDSVRHAPGLSLVTTPSNRNYYLAFSELTDTPLKNPEVRRALWYAIDTKSLIKQQLAGQGLPLSGQAIPKNFFGFDPSLKAPAYDPQKAKQMLADAGYPNGFSITFKYTTGYYSQDKEIGQAISEMLAKVGVQAKQEVLESGTFLNQIVALQLNDMFFQGPLLPPDGHFIYQQFKTGFAYSYYSNKDFDALLAQETNTVDPGARKALVNKMAELFAQDPPYLPLYQGVDTYAVSKDLAKFDLRPNQFLDLRTAQFKS